MVTLRKASLDKLLPMSESIPEPQTPQSAHATANHEKAHSISGDSIRLTPPPSMQVASSRRARTPTPTYSSMSTPPPTLEANGQTKQSSAFAFAMTSDELASAGVEDLRAAVDALQSAYREAKMNAAHYKLQYQMLVQESSAAIERMVVEARMAQHESDVIHAEQVKVVAPPAQQIIQQDTMIPVQKDLYQSMCAEIQHLTRVAQSLHQETIRQDRVIVNQENEIESLAGRVALMKDRIRANRDKLHRQPATMPYNREVFATPSRRVDGQDQFAALLQASEMASQEAKGARRKSGGKHVTMTPQRYKQHNFPDVTPSRQPAFAVPATAPVRRTEAFVQPNFAQVPRGRPGPRSDDTVSNSDRDIDSEAETDIIEPDGNVAESQASLAASLMLRSSQEGSFHGLSTAQPAKLKQTRLFGAVRKPGIDRDDGPPAKKARTGGAVGLGIVNARP